MKINSQKWFSKKVRDNRDYLIIFIIFILSRAVIYTVRPFEYHILDGGMAYIDPNILRSDLLKGLYYLNCQPPLYNLFLGVILKIAPAGLDRYLFSYIYSVIGIFIPLLTYSLMLKLGGYKAQSLIITIILMLTPSICLAERWLYYGYPLALMLVISAMLLYKYIYTQNVIYCALFIGLLALIVLARGFFHLFVWMAPIVMGVTLFTKKYMLRNFKVSLAISFIFILVASVPYVKNYTFYGIFGPSTYFGSNIAGMTHYVSKDKIERLINSGEITRLALIGRFAKPEVYFSYFNEKPHTGIALLDDPYKSKGSINFHNAIYIKASQEYQKNTMVILKHYPMDYLHAVANSMYIFFNYSPYYFFNTRNEWLTIKKDNIATAFKDIVYKFMLPPMYLIVFIMAQYGFFTSIKSKHKAVKVSDKDNAAAYVVCIFCIFNILYVFGVAIFLEIGEQCYFRIPIDPFLSIGVVQALSIIIFRKTIKNSCATIETKRGETQ